MFRYKRGVQADYNRQGYIYFTSRMYRELPEKERGVIRALCRQCGGEHWQALFEFVTTDATAGALSEKYYLSRETLYRAVRRYYESFPKKL